MLEHLASGRLPIRTRRLPWMDLLHDADNTATFRDSRTGILHEWLWGPGVPLDLDPAHALLHRRDAAHHARWLFQQSPHARPPPSDERWSPLISLQPAEIPGGPAAVVLHRTAYEPGNEVVVGHLLVPTGSGLFEWRWRAATDQTGWRESVLLVKARERDPTLDPSALSSSFYDDPAHDTHFRGHVLSLARSAGREILFHCVSSEDPVLVVTPSRAPPPPLRSFSVPPRFLSTGHIREDQSTSDSFARASLSCVDGIDHLVVEHREHAGPRDGLAAFAEQETRLRYTGAQAQDIQITSLSSEGNGDVLLLVEAIGHRGPLRGVFLWRLLSADQLWNIQLVSTSALPTAEMLADLRIVAATLR